MGPRGMEPEQAQEHEPQVGSHVWGEITPCARHAQSCEAWWGVHLYRLYWGHEVPRLVACVYHRLNAQPRGLTCRAPIASSNEFSGVPSGFVIIPQTIFCLLICGNPHPIRTPAGLIFWLVYLSPPPLKNLVSPFRSSFRSPRKINYAA